MNAKVRRRRQTVTMVMPPGDGRILEVGALASPTFGEMPSVEYLDWFSKEELQQSLAGNLKYAKANFVDVHHVVKSPRFAEVVDQRFDVVIANHVLEHVPDAITWFDQVHRLTAPGGHLCMALPDRRFTFDYLRPESTVDDLLRANDAALVTPSFEQMLEHLYFYRPVTEADFVGGLPLDELSAPRFPFEEAVRRARAMVGRYVDVHCHVFTYDSFRSVMHELRERGLVRWRVSGAEDVADGSNEFLVVMERT